MQKKLLHKQPDFFALSAVFLEECNVKRTGDCATFVPQPSFVSDRTAIYTVRGLRSRQTYGTGRRHISRDNAENPHG